MTPDRSVIALSRFGLGPRPGGTQRIAADPKAAILAELRPENALISAPLPDTTKVLGDYEAYRTARNAREEALKDTANAKARAAAAAKPEPENPAKVFYGAELALRMERAAAPEVGFTERLVGFWTNHFAIEADSNPVVRSVVGAFEREAIRPYVLGKFSDMLVAVTQHAAMLSYLNNAESVGPGSTYGQRSGKGLNENHARELMELHTVGVDGGYTQADVTALARILTGWSTSRGRKGDKAPIGAFMFRAATHEPGPQTVMGKTYRQKDEAQGMAVLMDLAASPKTASHIATKVVRHFVADDPPKATVDAVAEAFRTTGGDLAAVARALINSEEAWTAEGKFKTPQQYLVSAVRALAIHPKVTLSLQVLRALGQVPWDPPSPAGFDDRAATWLAPDAMTSRLDAAERLAGLADAKVEPSALLADLTAGTASRETTEAVARAESRTQGLALLLMSPEFQRS